MVLENEALRVVVAPEKGADIVSFVDKRSGVDVMLRLPMGLRSPKTETALLNQPHAREAFYEGGWQELFPVASECGDYCEMEQPFHGEAAQLMWDYAILEDSASQVCVADPASERLADTRCQLESRGVRWHSDYRKLLEQESELDAVAIAAPIHLHMEITTAAIARDLFCGLYFKCDSLTIGRHFLFEIM